MQDKHYEMLGLHVRDMIQSGRVESLNNVEFGRIIERYVATLEIESQRDARDAANGKGH
jgi:hypothetical protein